MALTDTPSHRIKELDGLRGLAVVAVMMWHFVGSMVPAYENLTASAIQSVTVWGRSGVDLFFVLSGFLIIGILVDNRDNKNVFKIFYLRRALRIYPPYLALIAAYWLCYALVGESPGFNTNTGIITQLIAQITFTWNWLMAITNSAVSRGFSVTWSVAIEEWFYLLAPWILVTIPRSHLVKVLVGVGLFSIIGRIAMYAAFPSYSLAPYILPPFRLDALCAGGLLAIGYRNPSFMALCRQRAGIITNGALAFAIATPL